MSQSVVGRPVRTASTVFPVLGAISFCHFLNDTMQSLLPALYPVLKGHFALNFRADRLPDSYLPDYRLPASAACRVSE
ncbi:hypothetical protein [Acetobacter senegalensis]|uniref:hypothetical protein n=1 Tax=Acetobacter senegalensis TaxID=446692 RepID=UPI003452A383